MSARAAAAALLVGLALAPMAPGQLAQSASYDLLTLSFGAAGGGSSSDNGVSYTSLSPLAGQGLTSPGFGATPGLVPGAAPIGGTTPVVWDVLPATGDQAGSVPVAVSGFNFHGGVPGGAATRLFVGGVTVQGLVVVSNTRMTANTPAGSAGPADVRTVTPLGSATDVDGHLYTPAVVTSPQAMLGAPWRMASHGSVGATYQTWISAFPDNLPTKFGTLFVGAPRILLFPSLPYSPPDGVSRLQFDLPVDPAFSGFTLYLQNLHLPAVGQPELVNLATSTFL